MHSPAPMPHTTSAPAHARSSGARMMATDGRVLPLTHTMLRAEAGGGIARVILEQRFRNTHDLPLAVKYLLPLPADGAVSGYRFQIGGRVISGEIDKRARARERFEQALSSGRTAALLEEDRSSVFTQEIGNIPPHAEIIAEVIVDQPLSWLSEGAWEWRFPTVVGPRYMGKSGRVPDEEKITVDVAGAPIDTRMQMVFGISDGIPAGRRPESASHLIDVELRGTQYQVTLRAHEGARLDRDVVVRWPVAEPAVGVSLQLVRPAASVHGGKTFGLVTIVPPLREANVPALPRDLIVLIDTSGSMSGRPLEQSKRIVSLLIESLTEQDRLELIEFGSSPRRWHKEPVLMTHSGRMEALKWVRALATAGGTEMRAAVLEALAPLRPDAQRQIVLITDGYVGFEREIIREVLDRLPRGSRLHTVGVGSSVNRTLTQWAARAGAGVEIIVGLDEDPERGAHRLVARTEQPLVTELVLDDDGVAEAAPRRLPDLFAGAPVKIAVELTAGAREVHVRGKTAGGRFDHRAVVQPIELGAGQGGIAALFARELVQDREAHLAAGGDRGEIDAAIERIGIDFQIATRLTSWVAITEERTVDPGSAMIRDTMPHEVPYGISIEAFGLRPAAAATMAGGFMRKPAPSPAAKKMAPGRAAQARLEDLDSESGAGGAEDELAGDFGERADLELDEVSLGGPSAPSLSMELEEPLEAQETRDVLKKADILVRAKPAGAPDAKHREPPRQAFLPPPPRAQVARRGAEVDEPAPPAEVSTPRAPGAAAPEPAPRAVSGARDRRAIVEVQSAVEVPRAQRRLRKRSLRSKVLLGVLAAIVLALLVMLGIIVGR